MSQWVHTQTNKMNSLLFLRENSEQLRFGWNRRRVSPARLPGAFRAPLTPGSRSLREPRGSGGEGGGPGPSDPRSAEPVRLQGRSRRGRRTGAGSRELGALDGDTAAAGICFLLGSPGPESAKGFLTLLWAEGSWNSLCPARQQRRNNRV